MWCLSTLTRCLTQGELILLADWAPRRLAELWYGVDVSATNSTRRLMLPLGLVSKLNCLTPLSGPCTTWLPRSTLRPMCNQAATLHSQTSVQLDCHAPLSDQWAIKLTRSTLAKTRTATRALWEQLLLLLPMFCLLPVRVLTPAQFQLFGAGRAE